MASDTSAFLETVVGERAHLGGWSDGAIVALLIARLRPDLNRKLVFIAGVFHRHEWVPGLLDPDNTPPEFLARVYSEVSPDGPEHYRSSSRSWLEYTPKDRATAADITEIGTGALVMIGDDDEVTLEHAIELYRSLPAGPASMGIAGRVANKAAFGVGRLPTQNRNPSRRIVARGRLLLSGDTSDERESL
jgi:pimeloyl-ACP methyl ester carboxylesterase